MPADRNNDNFSCGDFFAMKAPNGTGGQPAATQPSGNNDTTQTTPATGSVVEEVIDKGQTAPPGGAVPRAQDDAPDLARDHLEVYEGFDPAVHAVDQEGKPIPKKGGGWQKKRGGNMRGAAAAAAPGAKPGPAAAPVAKVDTLNAARAVCNSVVAALVIVFGEEWAPRDKTEADALSGAVKNYFDAKGAVEVSPGTALALVVLAYSAPRLKHENTRGKLLRMKDGVVRGLAWLKGRFSR